MKGKKIISVILSVLMVCSIFGGITVSASTTDVNHTYTVAGDASFLVDKWLANSPANDMELQPDGSYKKTYTNVEKERNCQLKIVEDHSWTVSFGGELNEYGYLNYIFSVPEDNSTVDVIFNVTGTRVQKGVEVTDGTMRVLVNGKETSGIEEPKETTHYVAGDAGLCNGINWDKTYDKNKMTKNEDGSFEITFTGVNPKEDGSYYAFSVTTNGYWEPSYTYYGEKIVGDINPRITIKEPNSTVKIVLTAKQKVKVYINGEESTPELPTSQLVSGLAGVYTGPSVNRSKRYFFAMPDKWYYFNNATACAYWWSGEDACTDWVHSYQMRPTSIKASDDFDVYYIDVAENVNSIVFTNGIEGGRRPYGDEYQPNWSKNAVTNAIDLKGYKAGECDLYPNGINSFDNMIYVINPNDYKEVMKGDNVNDCSIVYGGEWYYLHSDGKWDTTSGSTYEIKDTNVKLNQKKANLTLEKTLKLIPTFENVTSDATVKWQSSNVNVATVDDNGLVTAKSVGETTVSVSVQNPTDTQPVVAQCVVKVIGIEKICVSKLPSKTEYFVGDELDKNGLEVTVYYADDTSSTITDYTLDYDFSAAGEKLVTVKYLDFTDSFVVNVVSKIEPTIPTTEPTTKPAVKKVTKVALSKKTVTLVKGKSMVVKATVTPSNATNKKVKWTTSNSKVATVNASGKITAKGKGVATIKVMAQDGSKKYATLKVTVKQPVTSVKLNRKTATLKLKGKANQKTVTLKATVLPKNANNKSVTWKSTKTKVATVNAKGKVTAKKKGTCNIIATAKDGSKKSAKCKITVK